MALFDVRGKPEEDPGIRFLIGRDEETNSPVHFWVRRIPRSIAENIELQHPGKLKRPKFGGGGQPVRVRTEKESNLIQQKKLAWALVRIDGPLFRIMDDAGAKEFSEALGTPVQIGVAPSLNGNLSLDAKLKIFEYIPAAAGIVADKLVELNHLVEQEEEAELENLPSGSSGKSPQSSPE